MKPNLYFLIVQFKVKKHINVEKQSGLWLEAGFHMHIIYFMQAFFRLSKAILLCFHFMSKIMFFNISRDCLQVTFLSLIFFVSIRKFIVSQLFFQSCRVLFLSLYFSASIQPEKNSSVFQYWLTICTSFLSSS